MRESRERVGLNSRDEETEAPGTWGIDNDYTRLRDALLGRPEHYRWVDAGPITRRTLQNHAKTGAAFDLQTAMAQHAGMVRIFEDAGVTCHYLAPDEVLHRNFFARDSSVMTPWGALICHMQLKCRRADYVSAIRFYKVNLIPIWKYATSGHFEGGDFVILEPGKALVGYCGERSEEAGAEQVAAWVRKEGWEVLVVPVSRKFDHMDGLVVPLVVPLAPKLLVACPARPSRPGFLGVPARAASAPDSGTACIDPYPAGFPFRKVWPHMLLRPATEGGRCPGGSETRRSGDRHRRPSTKTVNLKGQQMKKLLAAATALALVGGSAFAEITISGDAKLGIEYNSAPTDENGSLANKSKQMLMREIGVDFIGSGTTDGGLSFGGKVGFDTFDGTADTGTVFVSGAFGTLTYGHDDAADVLAGGIADVGLNDLGVDDVVEDIRGGTAPQARYDLSVGNFAFAISAETSDRAQGVGNIANPSGDLVAGSFEVEKTSYAIGVSFSASGATVGVGYDSKKAISAGIGYSNGPIAAKAFWAKRDQPYAHLGSGAALGGTGTGEADGTFDAGYRGHGIEVSYTTGASTLTMVYARTNLSKIQPIMAAFGGELIVGIIPRVGFRGAGVGFSHDLGGGARLVAGFGRAPRMAVGDLGLAEIGQIVTDNDGDNDIDIADRPDLSGVRNVASMGLSFLF